MNIILDAYFDCNYGDDLFIECITSLLPEYKFYAFLEHYPEKIVKWAQHIPNLYALPESELFLDKNMFDAYVCVGGDIFPDGGDFSKRKSYVKSVKEINGTVAFLGFSMFHEYSDKTIQDIEEVMQAADIIAPRDSRSADILKQLLPDKPVYHMADLAFSTDFSHRNHIEREKSLGISIRRPNYADEEMVQKYIANLADVIRAYLCEEPDGTVKILCLSDGINCDRDISQELIGMFSADERIEEVVYHGDTEEIKEAIAACELVICTRLHAMISCIAFQVPFIPIVYEVKMDHILREINYKGKAFEFSNLDGMTQITREWLERRAGGQISCLWDKDLAHDYMMHSNKVFDLIHELLGKSCGKIEKRNEYENVSYIERIYGKNEARIVEKRCIDSENMEKDIKSYLATIEALNTERSNQFNVIQELNDKNAEYFDTIENLNKRNKELNDIINDVNTRNGDLFKLVEELNTRNSEQFNLIEELNSRNVMLTQQIEKKRFFK